MNEIWKDSFYHGDLYEVSSLGRIRNKINKKIRINHKINSGYFIVTFSKNRVPRNVLIHRLVYETFIKKIPPKMTINHIDSNKENNSVDNLECVTQSVNNSLIKNGTMRGVSKCPMGYGWFSSIRIDGKTVFLGRFKEKDMAYSAYKKKFEEINGFSPW